MIVALQVLLVGGVSLLLASAQVFTQDVERIWSIVLRVGFFMVPIFYSTASVESELARFVLQANPLTQIMTFSRDVLIDGRLPSLTWMLYTGLVGGLLFSAGITIFRRVESSLAERV
jgi:teichoic acid transport system permease protein